MKVKKIIIWTICIFLFLVINVLLSYIGIGGMIIYIGLFIAFSAMAKSICKRIENNEQKKEETIILTKNVQQDVKNKEIVDDQISEEIKNICLACNEELFEGSNFCSFCGTKIQ